VLSGLVGASLATAGVVFQGLLLNPLADPFTIGVSTGAAFGVALLVMLGGCRQERPETGMIQVKIESHVEDRRPVAVSFGIEPEGKQSPDWWKYKATYTRKGKTARFGVEFLMTKTATGRLDVLFGNGSIIAGSKSPNQDLLKDLQSALKASSDPQQEIRVRRLPFRFMIQGENLDRGRNGELIDTVTGDWVKAKLFLGTQQDQEVFLNFQKRGGTGEFVMAGPAFGNAVLQELAKVL
jgi:hypothetical protein